MLYRHKKRYQAILQAALRSARKQTGFDVSRLVDEQGEIVSDASLRRFSQAKLDHYLVDPNNDAGESSDIDKLEGKFLDISTAKRLWDFFSSKGYIASAIREKEVDKNKLYTSREAANAVHCLLNAHESRQIENCKKGLSGEFVMYKKSVKRSDFIVKSRVFIKMMHDEYFEIREYQQSSPLFNTSGKWDYEETQGFGIIKTNRLWIFSRESNHEQPRLFCFYKPIIERSKRHRNKNAEITLGYFGHVMEGVLDEGDNFFSLYSLLVSREYDERLWKADNPKINIQYDFDKQHDVFPFTDEALQKWGHLSEYRIPQVIVDYLIYHKKFD